MFTTVRCLPLHGMRQVGQVQEDSGGEEGSQHGTEDASFSESQSESRSSGEDDDDAMDSDALSLDDSIDEDSN